MMRLLLLYFCLLPIVELTAQNVKDDMKEASILMGDGKYNEAYSILQKSSDKQAEEISDTCVAYLNYYKGSCLYYMKKYQDAIPCLQRGIQAMDKLHFKNCDYLEMMYGMGTCYKELKDYTKAEEFLRRTILKGNYLGLDCAIRNQTYIELADLYTAMGKKELADICTKRIESEIRIRDSKNLETRLSDLDDLYDAYKQQGKTNECVDVLRRSIKIIDEAKGKVNDDYLSYSYLLAQTLNIDNRQAEAATIFKEMIEIGKSLTTNKSLVSEAYKNFLDYLARTGNTDSIKMILPSAVKYYTSTIHDIAPETNLYEMIGVGLCDANKMDEGLVYLEKKWKGKSANSIRALSYLGNYYFKSNPEKALTYYQNIEIELNKLEVVDDGTKRITYESIMMLNERLGNFTETIKYAEFAEPLVIKLNDYNYYLRFLVTWAADCVNANDINKANSLAMKAKFYFDKVTDDIKIISYSQIGFVYLKSDKLDDAISIIDKGIELAIRVQGVKTPLLQTLYHNLGRSYMLKGNFAKALLALNKSKDLQMELNGNVMQRTSDYIKECEKNEKR